MARTVEDIMTREIHTVHRDCSVLDVARVMRDRRIGDVLVLDDDGALCGILTDRDIVVRTIAPHAKSPEKTHASEVCSACIVKLPHTATIDDAVSMMCSYAVRRVPIVRDGEPIGIVTIGDIARIRDPDSVLARITAAPPND
jgi:signal-transduction protein with cAMP-binding, CBS, and nucleotidyltransferase domain